MTVEIDSDDAVTVPMDDQPSEITRRARAIAFPTTGEFTASGIRPLSLTEHWARYVETARACAAALRELATLTGDRMMRAGATHAEELYQASREDARKALRS